MPVRRKQATKRSVPVFYEFHYPFVFGVSGFGEEDIKEAFYEGVQQGEERGLVRGMRLEVQEAFEPQVGEEEYYKYLEEEASTIPPMPSLEKVEEKPKIRLQPPPVPRTIVSPRALVRTQPQIKEREVKEKKRTAKQSEKEVQEVLERMQTRLRAETVKKQRGRGRGKPRGRGRGKRR